MCAVADTVKALARRKGEPNLKTVLRSSVAAAAVRGAQKVVEDPFCTLASTVRRIAAKYGPAPTIRILRTDLWF